MDEKWVMWMVCGASDFTVDSRMKDVDDGGGGGKCECRGYWKYSGMVNIWRLVVA